ncbi:kinase-like domain-containing protein [Rhizophagus irregularis DAOM 181602=DAOM 197198]|nr:kinase-like domain-containing protein [Rhizophagus irregularis DAOM 181602=DAOM 197198]
MSAVRKDSINAIINKAYTLMDNKIHDDIHKKFEFQQKEKEGFAKIVTKADWIGGNYNEWDMEKNQLKRFGTFEVILKSLENVESASHSWFEEAKSHLTINNKRPEIVRCYGLTRDISNGNYMLVMMKMDMDLREYLQRNHHQLTWKKRIRIIFEILDALYYLHIENAIHRDLHSGNILYSQFEDYWYISDLGFCGPADKPSKSIYGNLPYIAPEVFTTKKYSFASDIYSIAMLMWEVSFGQPPFINCEHNFDLIVNIIGGLRPNFASEIPLEYKNLIEICWNADPLKRLDIYTLRNKIIEISKLYQNMLDESFQSNLSNLNMNKYSLESAGSRLLTYQFNSPLPNTKNVSEMLTVEYSYSKLYEFVIPNNYIEEDHLY